MLVSKPIRIQRKRTKGWRMPPDTVYLGRPTIWGNPFYVKGHAAKTAFRSWIMGDPCTLELAGLRASMLPTMGSLRGKNLCCWCKLTDACHADVLLEIANG